MIRNACSRRESEVAVLFCDLRGFSRTSERSGSDLLGLLERVSKALGVMTHQILDHGGVVGDFQGDAAMGFWGWPLPQSDIALRAALAALGIRAQFEAAAAQPGHPLADFRAGIGIATGLHRGGKNWHQRPCESYRVRPGRKFGGAAGIDDEVFEHLNSGRSHHRRHSARAIVE